jgi:hypothetical protein
MDEWWPHRSARHLEGHDRPAGRRVVAGSVRRRQQRRDLWHGAYVDPYKLVGFVGQWGMFGAAWAGGYYKFTEQDGGTLLKTHGETMWLIPEEVLEGRRKGSKLILEVMKKYIEDGVKYVPAPG